MEASSFARRLRNSKVVRYNPRGPPVTITAHPTWVHHDEYGLKSRLPSSRRSSPYVQVSDMDNEFARPTWRPATQEALFAERWEESGLGASPPATARDANFLATSHYDPTSVPDKQGLALMANGGSRSPRAAPDFAWLTDRDFERYLDRLRDLRPAFKAFCEEEEQRKRDESLAEPPRASTSKEVDLFHRAQSETATGDMILRFLGQQCDELNGAMSKRGPYVRRHHKLQPYPHPVLGLQYAPPSTFHNARFADPIPARLLSKALGEDSHADGYLASDRATEMLERADRYPTWSASALGIVAKVRDRDILDERAGTEWLSEEQSGYRDNDVGKGLYRVHAVEAETRLAPKDWQRRSAAQEPWLFEAKLDELGGHRNVRRDGGVREWLSHPGVPERPIKLSLKMVDPTIEAQLALPGSARWVSGGDGKSVEQRVFVSRPFITQPLKSTPAPQPIVRPPAQASYRPRPDRRDLTPAQREAKAAEQLENERVAVERIKEERETIARSQATDRRRIAQATKPLSSADADRSKMLADLLKRLSRK